MKQTYRNFFILMLVAMCSSSIWAAAYTFNMYNITNVTATVSLVTTYNQRATQTMAPGTAKKFTIGQCIQAIEVTPQGGTKTTQNYFPKIKDSIFLSIVSIGLNKEKLADLKNPGSPTTWLNNVYSAIGSIKAGASSSEVLCASVDFVILQDPRDKKVYVGRSEDPNW